MATSPSANTEKILLHVSSVQKIFQESDAGLGRAISEKINCQSHEGTINTAICKWIRDEIYGEHRREHHAIKQIHDADPIGMLKHIGRMVHVGYLKYVDDELAGILEKSEYYSDRYLMFTFLEWLRKNRPLSKLKFFVPQSDGLVVIKDKCRGGIVISEHRTHKM